LLEAETIPGKGQPACIVDNEHKPVVFCSPKEALQYANEKLQASY